MLLYDPALGERLWVYQIRNARFLGRLRAGRWWTEVNRVLTKG